MSDVLLLFGDTNVQRTDPLAAFGHVRGDFGAVDAVVCHAEGLFSGLVGDVSEIPHKPEWRHSDARVAGAFVEAGVSAVSCASNVSYPRDAVRRSVEAMERAGLRWSGIGRNRAEARRPALFSCGGTSIGLLSYTSVFWPYGHAAEADEAGAATIRATTSYRPHRRVLEMPGVPPEVVTAADPADLEALVVDVALLRQLVDFVVVSCHWGLSGCPLVLNYQREIAQAAIDAGAGLVFGHHPHVIQGVELWRSAPIFYSLGNFAFDWPKMVGRSLEGIGVRSHLWRKRLESIELIPVKRDVNNDVRILSRDVADGLAVLAQVQRLSPEVSFAVSKRGLAFHFE